MKPATLQTIQVLVTTAGTPKALSSGAQKPGVLATMLTIWPGKGANGRTANTGIVYIGFGTTVAPTFGVAQIAQVTAVGTVSGSGLANVTFTTSYDPTTPVVIPVAVLSGDTPTVYAAKIVLALNANPQFSAQYVASSAAAVISVKRIASESGEDPTLAVQIATGTATGITTANSSITTVDTPATIAAPSVWMPIAVAPTVPFQLFPDLIAGGLDLSLIFVDAATSGDGVTVLAVSEPHI